ncbi:MAG: hypothetical protein GYA57_07235 [Myxococcales bacterium]|nr:hypothetical protein [Myxococcales bacterium]
MVAIADLIADVVVIVIVDVIVVVDVVVIVVVIEPFAAGPRRSLSRSTRCPDA